MLNVCATGERFFLSKPETQDHFFFSGLFCSLVSSVGVETLCLLLLP